MRTQRRWAAALGTVAMAASALPVLSPTVAAAAAPPTIVLTATAPPSTLIGDDAPVDVRACNPGSVDAFNLSFRVVLPAGAGYVSASAGSTPLTPAAVLAAQPAPPQQTVIFANVTDLLAGACSTVSIVVASDPDDDVTTFPVGSALTIDDGAYVSADARFVPAFDATTGAPTLHGDASASATTTTTVAPFELAKTGPGEMLRGAHDHPYRYELKITNNARAATTGFSVTDTLPPFLELLGCTPYLPADNTTASPSNPGSAEEWAGSGPLATGGDASCLTPSAVTTLPDGTTRVDWSDAALGGAATLAPGADLTIHYWAAIPLRANTATWTGATPSPASLLQGRNLDNNAGAFTNEQAGDPANAGIVDGNEPPVTNSATAAGTYTGPVAAGSSTFTATDGSTAESEDLQLDESVSGQVVQGTILTTTVAVRVSEYRDDTDLIVRERLPNGTCPMTTAVAAAGCTQDGTDPTVSVDGGAPVPAPLASATEQADGTWLLRWDAGSVPAVLTAQPHDTTLTFTLHARVRATYRADGADTTPVLAGDDLAGAARVSGTDAVRPGIDTVNGDPQVPTFKDDDGQAAVAPIFPSIDKQVAVKTGPMAAGGLTDASVGAVCAGGSGALTWSQGNPAPVTGYGPGDYVCYDLRATFPPDVDALAVAIDDFVPPGQVYVAGSSNRNADDTAGATTVDEADAADIKFVPNGDGHIANTGVLFHWTLATKVVDPNAGAAYDIAANLMKMRHSNTSGAVFQYRDQADAEWNEPQLDLTKGVQSISGSAATAVAGPLPPNTDHQRVQAGDVVTFRVDVTNDGNGAASNATVWDVLPTGLTCASVSAISAGGTCPASPGNRVEWSGLTVAGTTTATDPAARTTLTFAVAIPATVSSATTYTNDAGVVSYQGPAVNGGPGAFTYVPAGNIDPSAPPTTTVHPARDTSDVFTGAATGVKRQQSSVTEAGNRGNAAFSGAPEDVAIGETVHYRQTYTLPEGTTTYHGVITDPLPAGSAFAGGTTVTSTDPALAAGTVVATPAVGAGGTVTATLPATWVNAPGSGDDTVVVSFDVVVTNVVANGRGSAVNNIARLNSNSSTGAPLPGVVTNTARATVVEPAVAVAKTDDAPGHRVQANASVTYTLTITNPTTAGNVSTAHDLVMVDHVPVGITPAAPYGGATWDRTSRTLTWSGPGTPALAALAPGGTITLTYPATVDDANVAGSALTNNVTVTSTSLGGPAPGERTATATASDTVNLPLPTLAKSVTPTTATVGQAAAYTLTATIVAGTRASDATIVDTVPDGIVVDGYGVSTLSPACTAAAAPVGIAPTAQADGTTTVGWWLDEVSAGAADCTVTVVLNAHVAAADHGGAPVTDVQTLVNTSQLGWNGTNQISALPPSVPAIGTFARSTPPATATVTVREPALAIDKDVDAAGCDHTAGNTDDADSCTVQAGTSLGYTLTVTNTGDAPAYDVTVTDQPDRELVAIVPGTGAAFQTKAWSGADTTMTWVIPGPIAPGASASLTYAGAVVASPELHPGDHAVNTGAVPSYFGVPSATRTAHPAVTYRHYGTGNPGPVDPDTVDLTIPLPGIGIGTSAVSDATDARVGAPFTWQIVVTGGSAPSFDAAVTDALPAGWAYVPGTTTITTPYGTSTTDPTCATTCAWTALVTGPGQPLAPGQTITIQFAATPGAALAAPSTTGPFEHVDTATVTVHDASGSAGDADGPYTATASAAARIRQADLAVAKVVAAGPYFYGATTDYTITVTNHGPDGATGVLVDERLPAGLLFESATASQGSYTAASGTWAIGALASGASATLVVRARFDAPGAVANDAFVTASDQYDPDSTPGPASPSEDDTASVAVSVAVVGAGDTVWYDLDGNHQQDHGEPGVPGVTVRLLSAGKDDTFATADDFWGPDGVSGTSDDIATTTTTTSASGTYGFVDLPLGRYRTEVDASTLPGGMTATFEDDAPDGAGADGRSSTFTLTAAAPSYLDADFGFIGTGSLGDLVWQDTDGDHTQNGTEPGLGGVGVSARWAGPDGIAGSGDDLVVTTTTGPDGAYHLDHLPAGPYSVTIDPATVTPGLVPVTDLDGGNDGQASVALAPGQDRTDVDFGYQPQADLVLTKTHTDAFAVGHDGTYTLTVANQGPGQAAAPLTLVDHLPTGLGFVSGGSDVWSCTADGAGTVTCTSAVALAAGATTAFSLVVSVAPEAAPSVTNTAMVTSPTPDGHLENNTASDATDVPYARLSVVKGLGAALAPGQPATYTITVTDQGPSPVTVPFTVTDSLPVGLAFQSASGANWACTRQEQVVTCVYSGALAVGESTSFSIVTLVTAGTGTTLTNTVVVGGGLTPGETPPATFVVFEHITPTSNPVVADVSILPATGGSPGPYTRTGLALLGLGAGLALVGRKRKPRPS